MTKNGEKQIKLEIFLDVMKIGRGIYNYLMQHLTQ